MCVNVRVAMCEFQTRRTVVNEPGKCDSSIICMGLVEHVTEVLDSAVLDNAVSKTPWKLLSGDFHW